MQTAGRIVRYGIFAVLALIVLIAVVGVTGFIIRKGGGWALAQWRGTPSVPAPAVSSASSIGAASSSGSAGAATSGVSGKQLGSGESWTVPAGFTCSGDLVVDGTVLYDEDKNTGMVVFFEQAAKVEAPWGASCVRGNRVDVFAQLARKNGCVSGCSEVTKYTWP